MSNILVIETKDGDDFEVPFNPKGILVWQNVENTPISCISVLPIEDNPPIASQSPINGH